MDHGQAGAGWRRAKAARTLPMRLVLTIPYSFGLSWRRATTAPGLSRKDTPWQ